MPERDCRGNEENPIQTALETLPLPAQDGGDGYKVGPGQPPLHSRWQKGQPSPNPRGRPAQRLHGPVSKALAVQMFVTIDGKRTKKSKRELLDRTVMAKAIKGDLKAIKLWSELQARDQRKRETDFRSSSSKASALSATSRALKGEQLFRALILRTIERHYPGLLDAIQKLEDVGAIQIDGSTVTPADWLQLPRANS